MKKVCSLAFFFVFTYTVSAQDNQPDSSTPLNLITTPNSPGFTILGITPQDIVQPQTPTDLSVSLLNSTQHFTTLPQNYSLEFAPAWIFLGKKISYDDFASKAIADNIFQTLTVSIATTDGFTADDTRMGTGIRFSIFRGVIDSDFDNYHQKIVAAFAALDSFNMHSSARLMEKRQTDPQLKILEESLQNALAAHDVEKAQALQPAVDARINEIAKEVEAELADEIEALKSSAGEIQVKRTGFKWDVAGATALDFVNNAFTNSYVTNSGVWTTLGYETRQNISVLATGRAMFQHANMVTMDSSITNLDGGIRLLFDKGKFNFSGEVLYRQSIVKDGNNAGQWKYDVNAAYSFLPNKTLTFSLGKNFDDLNTQYSGNLIAFLNILIGLGARRNLL